MKVQELAKELGMANKDVIAKANSIGMEVKSPASNLSDNDALALKNILVRGAGGAETKIVKVTPKARDTGKKDEEVRVTKKANIRPPGRPQRPKAREERRDAESATRDGTGVRIPARNVSDGPGATAGAASSVPLGGVPSGGAVPVRIPSARVAPKRIPREEVEAAERAKQPATADDATDKTPAAEKRANAEPKKKPALKVAWTDTGESAPSEETEKRSEATGTREEEQAAPGSVAPVASSTPSAPVASSAPSAPVAADRVATEPPAAIADTPKAVVATAASKGARDPKAGSAEGASARNKERQKPKQETGSPSGRAGKPDGKAGAERKDASKPKRSQPAPKSKDKKPQKGKSGDDKNKKYGAKGERRRGATGSAPGKSTILGNKSLEKRPTRSRQRPRSQTRNRQETFINYEELAPGTKILNVPITVAGFAEQVEKSNSDVIMALMKLGVMANVNQTLDETTVQLLGAELDIPIFVAGDDGEIVEEGLETFEDREEDLVTRPPIITVMGHVDHGKTSLLDAIRKTNVTGGEAGGITQHIGASEVSVNGEKIVFLDTPGHEALTAMRARGAHGTDMAVLVVAADDGVMPQTIESISHAKAAGVPVIVAINKIDKPGANPNKVKQELADSGVFVEDFGGDTICVPVSAKTGEGIVNLLEMILLQAEVLELRANPNRLAIGTVIEARLDKARGSVATLLVLNGTLETGMSIVAGITSGRIRAMTDYSGKTIRKAGPSGAVEVIGLNEVPQAGDEFHAVREDKVAREIAESRRVRQREEIMART
ncbi:MAG: translation initiation factor IF-2, partial [Clostridiales Family XIII bacterium]|nr:translation initiation factor IF-2 [Clostridiales Family XIII bacterium]